MLKIFLLCSDFNHPVYSYLEYWKQQNKFYHIDILNNVSDISENGGDLLFLVSCTEIVKKVIRDKFKHTFVLHASNLPRGRGWSPHIWSILEGQSSLTLTLLAAEDGVDTGKIWYQKEIQLNGTELYDEINDLLFCAEIELIDWACKHYISAKPREQVGHISYYKKRTPEDSRLDPNRTIAEQFNLLRVCDPNRFPAFFDFHGQRYQVIIKKVDN